MNYSSLTSDTDAPGGIMGSMLASFSIFTSFPNPVNPANPVNPVNPANPVQLPSPCPLFVFPVLALHLHGWTKVDQQAHIDARRIEVIDQLYLVRFAQRLSCLDLDKNPILNPQIDIIIAYDPTLIVNLDGLLLLHHQAPCTQFDR